MPRLKTIILGGPKYLRNIIRVRSRLTKPPIIIGGCGRSGTTLMLSILSAHPEIFAIADETRIFCPTAYSDHIDFGSPFNLRRFYFKFFNDIPSGSTRWCEKTPKNVLFFERILSQFKARVKLIHMVRDGRDVVLSKHPQKPTEYWISPQRWVRDVKAGLAFDDHPNVFTVKYEDLILYHEQTMQNVCSFLDLEYGREISEWNQFAKVRTHSAYFYEVKDLHSNSIGKWQNEQSKARMDQFFSYPEAKLLLKKLTYMQ